MVSSPGPLRSGHTFEDAEPRGTLDPAAAVPPVKRRRLIKAGDAGTPEKGSQVEHASLTHITHCNVFDTVVPAKKFLLCRFWQTAQQPLPTWTLSEMRLLLVLCHQFFRYG